jgi:ABC-2 type transport system ATP-binding protein
MESNSIEIRSLSKNYEEIHAIEDINFDVHKGELFGLIGPDGAGKTTLFRILVTLLLADKGTASIEGLDVVRDFKKLRRMLGYMPGRFSLYQDLTVEENLSFFATIFGTTIQENYDLIKDIYSQIEPFRKRRARALSGGMKQKLALSCAMIHKPTVLILDEPTTGVDAVSRREFWEMLKKLRENGMTILVSTAYMDEASLCDRVALIQGGKILKVDTPVNITGQFDRRLLALRSESMYELILDLQEFPDADTVFPFGEYVHYTAKSNNPQAEILQDFLARKGHSRIEIKDVHAGIEDCFMRLMAGKEEMQ